MDTFTELFPINARINTPLADMSVCKSLFKGPKSSSNYYLIPLVATPDQSDEAIRATFLCLLSPE